MTSVFEDYCLVCSKSISEPTDLDSSSTSPYCSESCRDIDAHSTLNVSIDTDKQYYIETKFTPNNIHDDYFFIPRSFYNKSISNFIPEQNYKKWLELENTNNNNLK